MISVVNRTNRRLAVSEIGVFEPGENKVNLTKEQQEALLLNKNFYIKKPQTKKRVIKKKDNSIPK